MVASNDIRTRACASFTFGRAPECPGGGHAARAVLATENRKAPISPTVSICTQMHPKVIFRKFLSIKINGKNSDIERSRLRARCAIPSSKALGTTHEAAAEALWWFEGCQANKRRSSSSTIGRRSFCFCFNVGRSQVRRKTWNGSGASVCNRAGVARDRSKLKARSSPPGAQGVGAGNG